MTIGKAGVVDFVYTETGVASGVMADVSTKTATGVGVGGNGVYVAYTPAVPATAIYDRAGATILDRAGAYIQVR